MAGYQKLSVLLTEELDQLKEEGRIFNREEFEKKIKDADDNKEKLMAIYEEYQTLPLDKNFKYKEPVSYEDIQKSLKGDFDKFELPDEETLKNKFWGAWTGRCVGCAFGQPVELWTAKAIKTWVEKADAWPLEDYLPTHSRAEKEDNMKIGMPISTKDNIKFMTTDDDIRYTVIGLLLLEEKGKDFDTWDVAYNWMQRLPFRYLCTAENQAYLNFVNIDIHGPWGKPDKEVCKKTLEEYKVNTYLNPYREWIGAQIRIDAYGYAAAGNPHLAADFAFRDADFSHVKNGTYGAMFFAALIAAAFGAKTVDEMLDSAMKEVPETSRFYEAMVLARKIGREASSREELIDMLEKNFGQYNFVHTINNAALCVAAIQYSKGDFNEAIILSVQGGWDTDCNGATVGSVMGAFCGEKGIPDKWKKPLNDTLYSSIPDFHPIAISEVAERTYKLFKKINE